MGDMLVDFTCTDRVIPEKPPSATCVLWDRQIVFIKRVCTEGTFFMKLAVHKTAPFPHFSTKQIQQLRPPPFIR